MSNPVQLKRSGTPGAKPAAGQLLDGELAYNMADGILFAKKNDGSVVALSGGSANGTYWPAGNITNSFPFMTATNNGYLTVMQVGNGSFEVSGYPSGSNPQVYGYLTVDSVRRYAELSMNEACLTLTGSPATGNNTATLRGSLGNATYSAFRADNTGTWAGIYDSPVQPGVIYTQLGMTKTTLTMTRGQSTLYMDGTSVTKIMYGPHEIQITPDYLTFSYQPATGNATQIVLNGTGAFYTPATGYVGGPSLLNKSIADALYLPKAAATDFLRATGGYTGNITLSDGSVMVYDTGVLIDYQPATANTTLGA